MMSYIINVNKSNDKQKIFIFAKIFFNSELILAKRNYFIRIFSIIFNKHICHENYV